MNAISLYHNLPKDRKEIFKVLIKHACSYCEKQFKTSNVGLSHGICERHRIEVYKQLGKPAPPAKNNKSVDLETLSAEEIKLAEALVKIIKERRNRGKI